MKMLRFPLIWWCLRFFKSKIVSKKTTCLWVEGFIELPNANDYLSISMWYYSVTACQTPPPSPHLQTPPTLQLPLSWEWPTWASALAGWCLPGFSGACLPTWTFPSTTTRSAGAGLQSDSPLLHLWPRGGRQSERWGLTGKWCKDAC